MLEKILVPYDYSKYSERALLFAGKLARTLPDASIIVFHVIQNVPRNLTMLMPFSSKRGESPEVDQFQDQELSNIKKSVDKVLGEDIAKSLDVQCEMVIGGEAAERIAQIVKDRNIDLIIIGAEGRTGLKKIGKIGSVSRKVLEIAPCPVTIVR